MEPQGDLASRYSRLTTERGAYMLEAYESALLTIPSIMPQNVDCVNKSVSAVVLPKPYQSIGARGVNTLANKLLLALFPPSSPYFRYQIAPELLADLSPEERAETETDLQVKLAARERTVNNEIDAQRLRAKLIFALRHLIVCGNVMLYLPPEGGMRAYPLNHFVVARDGMGNLLELIYVEILDHRSVPEKIRAILDECPERQPGQPFYEKPVFLYTGVCLSKDGKHYEYHQEVHGREVPGSKSSVRVDSTPWLVLRFTELDGEDYGRGFVEEYRGDLRSAEELAKAIVIGSLNAAKTVPLIKPGAQVKVSEFVKLQNGQPIVANADDVVFLQVQKSIDLQVARAQLEAIYQALAADFLLNSSFQRNAERVTAEEIRRMAEELENNLGGIYSSLSTTLQLPLAQRHEDQLQKRGALNPLPKGTVQPTVVTGIAAIGRGQDLQRLREFTGLLGEAAAVVPTAAAYVKPGEYPKRIAMGVGLDTVGLIKTDQEVQAEMQQAQQMQQQQALADNVVPELAKAGGAALTQQVEQNAQGAPLQ